MFPKFSGSLSILILCALVSFDSQAELFKWVDENGKIHYSDKPPAEKIKSKVIPKNQKNETYYQQSGTAGVKPIIRPYEKTSRKLHLLDTRYHWKRETEVGRSNKIGIYHTGKGCTSRGAIKTPDVFVHHKSLFPDESSLTRRISTIVNGLDYEAERTEKYRLLARLKKTGGLSLHAEIVAMELKTCAPSIRKSERLGPVTKIGAHRFKKNRVKVQVNWKLKTNRDQDVIFETETAGNYNGWSQSTSPSKAVSNALEGAVLVLFSDPAFISKILVEEDPSLGKLEFAGSKPITSGGGKPTRSLYVDADGDGWVRGKSTTTEIGNLLFGDKCAAKKPLTLDVALKHQKWLISKDQQAGSAIIQRIKPLGYSINPGTADTLASIDATGGYSLNARILKIAYDACEPSLSASTKYKSMDKIKLRRLSRNRVQVWMEWTLKTDRNRKLLYKTTTMGFGGDLVTDTRGSDALRDAIGMAAEQLFAERDFIQQITVKKTDVAISDNFKVEKPKAKGIVLPQGEKPHKLFLVNDGEPWNRLKVDKAIGIYAYGNDCIGFKERKWPQALNDYPGLFPRNSDISNAKIRISKSLGFPAQFSDQYNVVSMKRKIGALSLHGDIVDLRFDSCAPNLTEDYVYNNVNISKGHFKRHRLIVRIDWRLLDSNDEKVLFQKTTEGHADSWQLNTKARKIFTQAIEDATTRLYATPEFIAQMIVGTPQDEKGFFSNLLSYIGGGDSDVADSFSNRFVLQAHAAQVFSEVNAIKVHMVQHYMMEGDWPDSLSDIGVSDSIFNKSDSISYVSLQSDGSMVVELKELFGENKVITLSPEVDEGSINMNRWNCTSNLKQAYLPKNCEGI